MGYQEFGESIRGFQCVYLFFCNLGKLRFILYIQITHFKRGINFFQACFGHVNCIECFCCLLWLVFILMRDIIPNFSQFQPYIFIAQ